MQFSRYSVEEKVQLAFNYKLLQNYRITQRWLCWRGRRSGCANLCDRFTPCSKHSKYSQLTWMVVRTHLSVYKGHQYNRLTPCNRMQPIDLNGGRDTQWNIQAIYTVNLLRKLSHWIYFVKYSANLLSWFTQQITPPNIQ